MKFNHFKGIFFIGVLSFLLIITTAQAKTISIKHTDEGKIIQYGKPFSVEITDINQLDYEYSVKIEYELPKPHTIGGPSLPPGGTVIPLRLQINKDYVIEKFNDLLKNRLTIFGQDNIDKWFNELKNTVINDICSDDPACKTLVAAIEMQILEASKKKAEAGHLIIEKKDIANSMLKTKAGGALIITIEAKAKKWKVGSDGKLESNGTVVEKIDDLDLADDQKKIVADHIDKKIIRIEFEGPKGITFSMGPYLSFFLDRYAYGRIKNPMYEEGSTDVEKKDKYYIGYTEESKFIYGISAFWNAPLWKDSVGVCWGVAYNLQDKIDRAISGLMGLYLQLKKGSPALINFGFTIGKVEDLADGYEIKTAIGENEEIPLKTKLKIGLFISFSFKI